MSREKKVRDLMGALPSTEVGLDDDLKSVAAIIAEAARDGNNDPMVLVKDGDTIQGTITRSDLLEALEPPYTKGRIRMEVFWEGLFTAQWRNLSNKKVKQFMKRPVVIDVSDNLMKAVHMIYKHGVSTILVVDDNRVMGKLSIIDLMQELVKIGPNTGFPAEAELRKEHRPRAGIM